MEPAAVTALPKSEGQGRGVVYENDLALVAINKGEADQVKPGYTFDVYAGGAYKGHVRVQNVHGDFCTALVERQVDGQDIRIGDSATTRL